jgi:hypothetical protein
MPGEIKQIAQLTSMSLAKSLRGFRDPEDNE